MDKTAETQGDMVLTNEGTLNILYSQPEAMFVPDNLMPPM